MSTDRDVERIVRSWMDEGVTALPDRVLDAVLDQLPATPQRRAGWLARRFPIMRAPVMSNAVRIAIATAGVATVAVVAFVGLQNPDATSPSATPSATAVETPSSAPTAPELPALPMPGASHVSAGEYGWTGELGSITGMHAVVVPGDGTDAFRQTQIVFAVENDCFGSPRESTPTRVTVASLDGLYVEPYEPPDDRIVMFLEPRGLETTAAYALAIGHRTLCVYLSWDPTTTAAELAAARAVIESLRAEPAGATGIRIVFTVEIGWDTG